MEKKDLRFIKNEELIKNTFKKMIEEMNYEDITISELTKRANINRKTFYLHYKDLDDLLKAIQLDITSEYAERRKDYNLIDNLYEITKLFYLFSEEKGRYYEIITSSTNYTYIRNQMINTNWSDDLMQDKRLEKYDEATRKIIVNYMFSTTLFIYTDWIKSGKPIPVNQIIDLTYQIIYKGIGSLLK